MSWTLWAVMLMAQNACGTWTSRARNSTSLIYHAVASFFNNGVYLANLFVGVGKITTTASWQETLGIVLFYATFTMFGSILSHYVLMKHVEPRL